jgi:hypothetical protein
VGGRRGSSVESAIEEDGLAMASMTLSRVQDRVEGKYGGGAVGVG